MSIKDINPNNILCLYQIFSDEAHVTNFEELYSRLIDKRRDNAIGGAYPGQDSVGADLILLIADASLTHEPEGWTLTERGERQLEALAPVIA